MTGHEGPEEE